MPSLDEDAEEINDEQLDELSLLIEDSVVGDQAAFNLGAKFPWKKPRPVSPTAPKVSEPVVPKTPETPTTLSSRSSSSTLSNKPTVVSSKPVEIPAPTIKAYKMKKIKDPDHPYTGGYKEFEVLKVTDFNPASKPTQLAAQLKFGEKVYFAVPRKPGSIEAQSKSDPEVKSKQELEEDWTLSQFERLQKQGRIDYKERPDLSTSDYNVIRVIKTFDPEVDPKSGVRNRQLTPYVDDNGVQRFMKQTRHRMKDGNYFVREGRW